MPTIEKLLGRSPGSQTDVYFTIADLLSSIQFIGTTAPGYAIAARTEIAENVDTITILVDEVGSAGNSYSIEIVDVEGCTPAASIEGQAITVIFDSLTDPIDMNALVALLAPLPGVTTTLNAGDGTETVTAASLVNFNTGADATTTNGPAIAFDGTFLFVTLETILPNATSGWYAVELAAV